MKTAQKVRIERFWSSPLSVPLVDSFVISSGRMDVTRSALAAIVLRDVSTGVLAEGFGEAAALPPVTAEDQSDVLQRLRVLEPFVCGMELALDDSFQALVDLLDAHLGTAPVTRAGVETAFLDAIARLRGVPVREMIGGTVGAATAAFTTDITIPIGDVEHMVMLARSWRLKGFRCFKVKIGSDAHDDFAALRAIAAAVPDASFRLDANAGFDVETAIRFGRQVERLGVTIECFEQPCAADDLDGMALVAEALSTPVIADESIKTRSDLEKVCARKAADGVNLKLAKTGGILAAFELGRVARRAGLSLMFGGMVETRLGMTAAAHTAAALGGADFIDLDTAWLLREDPFRGGYVADGECFILIDAPGLGVQRA